MISEKIDIEDWFSNPLGIGCMSCKLKTFVNIYPSEFLIRLYIAIC